MKKQERRGERRPTQASLFDEWLQRFKLWIDSLFARQAKTGEAFKTIAVFESDWLVLKLLDVERSDELSVLIRYWLIISKTPEIPYDLIINCYRLKRSLRENLAGDLTRLAKTHRFVVLRRSQYLIGNRRRNDQIMIVDLDCTNFQIYKTFDVNANGQLFRPIRTKKGFDKLDGYAPKTIDALALQFRRRDLATLKSLILFEVNGVESMRSKKEAGDKLEKILVEYFKAVANGELDD